MEYAVNLSMSFSASSVEYPSGSSMLARSCSHQRSSPGESRMRPLATIGDHAACSESQVFDICKLDEIKMGYAGFQSNRIMSPDHHTRIISDLVSCPQGHQRPEHCFFRGKSVFSTLQAKSYRKLSKHKGLQAHCVAGNKQEL